ncbi:hypothetical protein HYU50_05350 [Candidatus Woesearchaeota archaeon]|nr:hypothetical protein [Candidatus Woesearchaeota archaeon]
MEKRGIFFLFCMLILLILAPNALSIYEELLFSDTVEDGDAVNISGKEFEFRIDYQSSKVFIEIDVSGLIVESGHCQIKDNLHICVQNVSFSYRNYDPWYDVYKAEVEIYQIKSSLDVTHTISKENLLIDEEATGVLSFDNTADISAKDVTATMPIPSNLIITEIEGCKQTEGIILFKNDVTPRQIKTCTYKVKGVSGGDYELGANVTYFNGVETESIIPGAITGKVYNYSLKIKYNAKSSMFNIYEKFNLTIAAENTNDEHDLTVTALSVKIPERLLLVKEPKEMTGTNKLLSWSGPLKAKESRNFTMELQSSTTGDFSIIADASYKISKFLLETEESFDVKVDCQCPYIEHDFSQNIVVAGQRAVLIADLVNPGPNGFKNVRLSYVTDVPGIEPKSTTYSSIRAGERIRVFDSSVIAPGLGEAYYFNVTSVYESSANEVFIKKKSIQIGVNIAEVETEEEDQQQNEEQIEEKKEENVSLTSEKIEEIKEEKEEEKKEGKSEGMPAVTIQDEKKTPFVAFFAIAFILGLVLFLVFLISLKKKKGLVKIGGPESMGKKRERLEQEIKEFLSSTAAKKETKVRPEMVNDILKTSADDLYELVKSREKISVEEAAKLLRMPINTVHALVDFLVEEKMFGIEYKFTTAYIYISQEHPKSGESFQGSFAKNMAAKEETEYENLAKQTREIGETFEKEEEPKKKGFLGRVFRKK